MTSLSWVWKNKLAEDNVYDPNIRKVFFHEQVHRDCRVECRNSAVTFVTILYSAMRWQWQNLRQTLDSQKTPLKGKLWDVFCEYFQENWPCSNCTALFVHALLLWSLLFSHRTVALLSLTIFVISLPYISAHLHTSRSLLFLSHHWIRLWLGTCSVPSYNLK